MNKINDWENFGEIYPIWMVNAIKCDMIENMHIQIVINNSFLTLWFLLLKWIFNLVPLLLSLLLFKTLTDSPKSVKVLFTLMK